MRGLLALTIAALILAAGNPSSAQPPGKKGFGKGKNDPAMKADMDLFHHLLDHRKDIKRTVKDVDGGAEAVTESTVPEVASKIKEHVAAMHKRVKEGRGVQLRDPLFAEIFKHADRIEKTDGGVRVRETSKDEYVAKLIRAHARVLNGFIENGHAEMRKNHRCPQRTERKTYGLANRRRLHRSLAAVAAGHPPEGRGFNLNARGVRAAVAAPSL